MNRLIAALALAAAAFPVAAAAALAPMPKAAQTFSSGSLRVQTFGDAGKPAMMFVPGLTCGPWEWAGEISRFSRDYHVYALTLPGFDGAAPIAPPLFKTVESDFWNLLQQQHIVRPIVIGHSLGGTLTIALAEEHPERLRAAIALDGLPVFPGTQGMTPAQRLAFAHRFADPIAAVPNEATFARVERQYVLPAMISNPADVAAAASLSARSDPKTSAEWALEDVSSDLRPGLPQITVPLLELVPYDAAVDGTYAKDAAAKNAFYQALLKGVPNVSVASIPSARHFAMLDQPQAVDTAIADWLRNLPAATAR